MSPGGDGDDVIGGIRRIRRELDTVPIDLGSARVRRGTATADLGVNPLRSVCGNGWLGDEAGEGGAGLGESCGGQTPRPPRGPDAGVSA